MIKKYFLGLMVFFTFLSCSQLSSYRKTSSDFAGYENFLFGYELTFTDLDLLERKAGLKKINDTLKVNLNKIRDAYFKKFKNESDVIVTNVIQQKKTGENLFSIQFPELKELDKKNLSFLIFTDAKVYEVTFNEMTLNQLRSIEEKLNKNIFNFFQQQGYTPHSSEGGGHINIDIKTAFEKNYAYLRNFVVDMINHDFLSMGVFRPITMYAFPWHVDKNLKPMFQEKLKSFKERLQKLDRKYAKKKSTKKSRNLYKIFIDSYIHIGNYFLIHREKRRENQTARFEWRVPPPQKNIDGMIYFSEFLAKRIVYIKNKYDEDGKLLELKENFSDEFTDEELFNQFVKYIIEMGETVDWEKHYSYFSKELKEYLGI